MGVDIEKARNIPGDSAILRRVQPSEIAFFAVDFSMA
jgi:hypothetical protein